MTRPVQPSWSADEDAVLRDFPHLPTLARRALVKRLGNPNRRTLGAVKRRMENLRRSKP